MSITRVGLLLIASSVIVACGQAEKQADVETEEQVQQSQEQTETANQNLEELGLEIRRMVKTPAADHPEQCKVVEMGHKPCGGPERYLLYSTKTMSDAEETEFLDKLRRYNQLSEKVSKQSDMVSDCQMLPEPGVVVNQGFCVPAEKNTM